MFFRRLGAIIDLNDNVLRLKGFDEAVEPLHDLRTGHIAINFLKPKEVTPIVSNEALNICMNGQEVTLADDELRKSMKIDKPSFGIHAISLEPPTEGVRRIGFGSE